MPSEASFSIIKAISEVASTRRAETARPEREGDQARPDTFGALVSDAVHARNAERKDLPPAETPKEPVDPRPAPDRRPEVDARAERSRGHHAKEGEASGKEERPAPTEARADKAETTGQPEETRACKDGCVEKNTDGEAVEVVQSEAQGKAVEAAGTETAAPVGTATIAAAVPGETPPVAAEGGISVTPAALGATGGPMLPPAADVGVTATAEGSAEVGAVGIETGKPAVATAPVETVSSGVRAETANPAKVVETPAGVTANTSPASAKPAGATTEAAPDAIKAEAAEGGGETATTTGKASETGSKAAAPDLNPTRLNRTAAMLDAFGISNAIHRPADILAGLDRAVQASAMNSAHNRAAEVTRATPLQMLPIEIGMQAVRGVTNFQIRLDPAELGRVDVKLQIRDNGEVNASLVVDRVETLAMLKRDASTLQQAFEQAGLRQSADGLSFSLRGEGQNGEARRDNARGSAGSNTDDNSLPVEVADMAMRRAYVPNSNLDLMI